MEQNRPKRLLSVQDLSCLGRCSLSIAMPVVSAMGVECVALPTAILSTHTAFPGNTCTPLDVRAIADHWKGLGAEFDGISLGYQAGPRQCREIGSIAAELKGPKTQIILDPAMADGGSLYRGLPEDHPQAMAELCAMADFVIPNVTEACLLTGIPYTPEPDDGTCKALLEGLLALGPQQALLTSVRRGGLVGVVGLDRAGKGFSRFAPWVPAACHGTGDLFAAVLSGGMLRGLCLEQAASLGAWFAAHCVSKAGVRSPWGLPFEPELPRLWEKLRDLLEGR